MLNIAKIKALPKTSVMNGEDGSIGEGDVDNSENDNLIIDN